MNQTELQQELNRIAWTGKAYRMTEPVTLTGPESLRVDGCYLEGWHPSAPHWVDRAHSTLLVSNSTTPAIRVTGPRAGIVGHSIYYPGQRKRGRPREYPVTIDAPTRPGINVNVRIESVNFAGAWSFIRMTHGGQHVIEDVRGQVLGGVGIYLDNAHDVIRINGVHFWPSWSTDEELMAWAYWNPDRQGNARGIVLKRVDWPQIDNVFVYGYHVGMQMGSNTDPQIGNLAFDACSVGLDIYYIGQAGAQVANYRFAGNRNHGAWRGVPIYARPGLNRPLQIGNLHVHGDAGEHVWQSRRDLLQIGNYFHA